MALTSFEISSGVENVRGPPRFVLLSFMPFFVDIFRKLGKRLTGVFKVEGLWNLASLAITLIRDESNS